MYGNAEATMPIAATISKAPPAPCDSAMDQAIKGQDISMALLDQMEGRLSSLLRDNPPKDETDSPEECPQSLLHQKLLNIGSTSDRINARINDLIGRLTV